MPTTLETHANEQSTFVINIAFLDEDDTPVIPFSAAWTLTDNRGNVINDRDAVEITSLAETVDILLSGDDLAIGANGKHRKLLVEALYDSTLGTNLPFKDEVSFLINDFVAVTS